MNTKSKLLKSIFISLILVMGVNNAWAAGQYNLNWQGKVYFLVPEKWNINTYSYIQVDITRTTSASSSNYQYYAGTMTQVGTSRLYYLDLSADHSSWKQNEYLAFTANDHNYGSGTFNLNGNVLRTKPIDYGCNNSSNFYLFKPDSESNFNTTTNDNTMSGDWNSKRDDLLLKKQTVELYLDNTKSNAGGTVKMTGYYFDKSDTKLASSDATSSSSSVSYDGVVGTQMSLVATAKSGYIFEGWYDGNTLLSSETNYNYYIYDTKIITARFKENTYSYTVTAGEGGSVTPTSGTVAQGSGVTITATPNDGYEFDKWTATNGTLANANSASTTFTPSANNANAVASFRVAGCTQTPTTPTSLTAKVGGNALAGEVCSGTSVTLTAGGSISVGSLQWGTGTVGKNIIAEGNGSSSITVSPAATTTYWVRSIITEAGVCYGVTSDAKTLQVSITPALVQPILSKSTLTLEEGGSTGSITVTSGTIGGTWTSSDQNVATVNNGTVTPKGPGTATITYTVSNACEADKTATCTVTVNAKPYYIAGRLQQKWDPNSKTQQFTYVSNGQYKYETGKTVAELSVGWSADNNYLQYFFIHTGSGLSSSFTSSNSNGHNFHQKLGYENALTLSSNSSDGEAKFIKFADTNDKSSGVVIWWEPSTKKLWYTAQKNYKITYGVGNNKGTDAVTTSPSITSGEPIDPSTSITFSKGATKAGYTWKNWNNKADGTGTNLGTGDTYVSSNRTGDITVYACYDLITYNITYNLKGGTGATNTTYNVTSNDITLPTTPTKTGYKFSGWYDNEGCTGEPITTIPQGSTGDKTFYAQWTANTYTITWDANGGTVDPTTSTYTYDGDPVALPTPKREGYTFNGWYTEKTDGKRIDNIGKGNNPTSNVTYYAQWNEIKHTVTISAGEGGSVSPSGDQQIGISGMEVTATPTDPSKFRFAKWEVSDRVQVADNYGATTTITASADGKVIAHFEELQPKTIYLKTVEGEQDGFKWYVKYNDTEVMMTPLGCTGEYYRGEVPEETEFQLIAKDDKGNTIAKETRDGLVAPDDNKNMINLVSAAAGGNKIFFKPNSHWLTKQNGKTPRFAAHFYNPNEEWIDLVATNSDGIYECEKPAGGYTQIQFYRMKENTTENNWNNKSEQTLDLTIPTDGKNLFTVDANQELGGNNDSGTWSEFADTPVNGEGEWTIFEGATYRITFNHEGAKSGTTTPGVAYVDAQYNSSMPTIESLPKNTDWKFAGYYTAANDGTPITNAFGDWLDADGYISNGKWVKEECVTLYAHWVEKTPEITNVALSKNVFDVGSVETVTATPTVVEHSYQGTYSICWKLLDNSGTVMDLFPFTSGDNNSVSFSVDGLTSGTYIVRASIYASACNTGEELSRFDAKITIVSGYKVTVKYLCGDNVIQAPFVAPGHASTPVEIKAPEIGGYKFVNWELGDGIFSESNLNSQTISYTAIYDGYLTAKYEKRKLIFLDLSTLPNKEKWTEPHIYLYKGAKNENTGGYWNDQTGAGGATGGNYITHAAMTKLPNAENIWYFDYEQHTDKFNVFVAFTSNNQGNATHFANCEAIYRTEFSSGTPVFVPASDQTAETKNSTAKYYSKGYWVKYMDGTGYWMIIYNEAGDKELVRREFTSETQRMTMTSIVDLEAEHTYKYEIYRNDGYYYNGGDITYTNSSTYRPLNEANKHSIKTTETGDYTFTLNYEKGDLQIKVRYPGEVGDYRILYTDDVREGRYKPSQIISQNNKEPLVSFFVRPNSNPELKIQTAAHITDGSVTWYTADNHIYFKPNDLWKEASARFAAYFYNGSKNEWKELTKNGDIYSCEKPSGYTHVIFVRLNPAGRGNSTKNNGLHWDYKWNQTGHLKLTTENLYTLKEGEWGNKLYLKPNSNWTQGDAWFAAYFFETGKEEKWLGMSDEDGDGVYVCDIPAENHKEVIFVRMNPNGSDATNNKLNWNNKWDQSTNQTVPTNGNTLFTVKDGDWNNAGGTWSVGEGTWNKIAGSITDLTEELKEKLGEIKGDIEKAPDAVYTIHLSNNSGTPTIENVALYTGNYYIRVDAVDGKWYDYKTNPDNLMTYSAFSESDENSFGEKFSHYKTKWCTQSMNVKFVIANDYSLCISDTLVQDAGNPFGNIDEHGNINNDGKYNANIRFMWNRHTNKVSRAYVAAASDEARKFLVLKANKTIQNESGQAINNNEVVFKDTQNWLYERTIKVQPGTLVKLYACYPDLDEANAQHFRGKYSNDFTEGETAVQILGGTNTEWYTMRIIYDFKTNRLMGAWIPDQNINGTLEIDADIMVIRQHQEDATYITFAKNGGQLTEVKTVYGVMRFNRWTLNNRSTSNHNVLPVQDQKSIYERALYFISFPFDVHLSDVFGFGTYGTHWVISEYNGLRRAQNGYFVDNCINEDCTNWDYIWDPSNFTMKANQGYLLSLDLDLMKHDNTSFWAHDIQQVELFFPSFAHVQTIKQTSYTMPALTEDYKCTINFNKVEPGENGYNPVNDHRVRDSYWRCIGVPSFADYNNTLTDGTNEITWNPKGSDLPFLYEWNVSDNSLMVRAAKNYKFRSTFAYLIQNGNPIYWSAVNTKPSNIVARRQAADEVKNYEWKLTLSRNEQVEDQAFVRLSDDEQITTEFDFNQDLSKEFNYGRSDIYTLIGYEKAAANSLPFSEQTTLIPLGLSIEYNGDYTIAMPGRMENIGVTLIDTESNTRTNLSAGMEYTLTLNKGDYNNRFFIEISPIQQTPTDIEYVTGDSNSQDSVRKVLIDNILYIVRDGQIFDARGARVK